MKVTVFGASGSVGQQVVKLAVTKGYEVTAFVRNKEKIEAVAPPNVKIHQGDATRFDDVVLAIQNTDVIISCLGNTKKALIMHASHDNILNAAAAQSNIPRCILISSVGCGGTSWLIKMSLTLIAGKDSFNDYEQADARIRNESKVPFCLVRPYGLTDKPGKGRYHATKNQNGTFMRPISRTDLAQFFVDAIEGQQWDGAPGTLLGGAS